LALMPHGGSSDVGCKKIERTPPHNKLLVRKTRKETKGTGAKKKKKHHYIRKGVPGWVTSDARWWVKRSAPI